MLVGVLAVLLRASMQERRRLEPTLAHLRTTVDGISGRIDAIGRRGSRTTPWQAIHESLDLDEVLERILEAAGAVGQLDGARVRISLPDGTSRVRTRGRVALDAAAPEGPPDGSPYVHAVVAWHAAGGDALRSGLAVPLGNGSLGVYSSVADAFTGEDAALLAAIATGAEPAVANALRHLEVLEAAATDTRTGFGSAAAFEQALPLAISAAKRHARPLCLMQIDLDDFGNVNKIYSHERGNQTLTEFGRRVLRQKRGSDSIFRDSGGADEFFLILPETTLHDAKSSYARLCFEVSGTPFEEVGTVRMSCGLAELREGETQADLLRRVGGLVQRAKWLGKNRMSCDDGDDLVCPH